ncbi:hypothetical protein D1872_301050 [compost metagenome]
MIGLVKEKTAHSNAIMTMPLPTQAVLETELVWFNTSPPIADPSEIPICSAELLKLCCISDVAGSV